MTGTVIYTSNGYDILKNKYKEIKTFKIISSLSYDDKGLLKALQECNIENIRNNLLDKEWEIKNASFDENGCLAYPIVIPADTDLRVYFYGIALINEGNLVNYYYLDNPIFQQKGFALKFTYKLNFKGEAGKVIFRESNYVTELELNTKISLIKEEIIEHSDVEDGRLDDLIAGNRDIIDGHSGTIGTNQDDIKNLKSSVTALKESMKSLVSSANEKLKNMCENFNDSIELNQPVGVITTLSCVKDLSSWLPCDGRSLKIKDYPDLYNAIGTLYGGDGVTYFKIIDLRNRFVRMAKSEKDHGKIEEDATSAKGLRIENSSLNKVSLDETYPSHTHQIFGHVNQKKFKTRRLYIADEVLGGGPSPYHSWEAILLGKNINNENTAKWQSDTNSSGGKHTHHIRDTEHSHTIKSNDLETRPKNINLTFYIKAKKTEISFKELSISVSEKSEDEVNNTGGIW